MTLHRMVRGETLSVIAAFTSGSPLGELSRSD